jgi:hypothetical protein
MQKVFKYKLDFYYQQALLYLLVFLLYAGIKGSFFEDQFSFVFKDPIVYIMILFVAMALVTLVLNLLRNRKLIIAEDRLMFSSRRREREIKFSDIEQNVPKGKRKRFGMRRRKAV